METDALMAILTGLFVGGGFFGAKGLFERFVMNRQQMVIEDQRAEQEQQSQMAGAVVSMAQDLSTAMVGLARETITSHNSSLIGLAQSIENLKTENGHQYRYLRQEVEGNSQRLNQMDGHIVQMNNRLNVIVEYLANGKSVRES
jgi:hypothetical protein